jgi:hypothetical protein
MKAKAAHVVHAPPPYLSREHRSEPVPPEPHRLVAKVLAGREEQVLYIPQ